jgi:DNA-binding GntR family transcriptional regulator
LVATTEPLQIQSVVDRVYAVLRARILDGDLQRGVRLRQEALADELGVSRTPLREALRRLAAEGLVEFHPNRGAQVAEVAEDAVRRAYEARLVMEPGSARLAAIRRPAAELATMRQAIEAERTSVDRRSAYQASRAFHLALVRASENDHLIRAAVSLWVPGVAEAIYERQAEAADLIETDVVEHQRILDAVESGDPELAEALARRHIRDAHTRVLEV